MKTADFASDLIIREARERKEAVAEVVMGKGWPYAAAAAAVELPGRPIPAVLVLAKPIDDAAVRKLAEKARGAVLLSDGHAPSSRRAPDAERELLRAAVGSETRGPDLREQGRHLGGGGQPVVPGPVALDVRERRRRRARGRELRRRADGRDLGGRAASSRCSRWSSACGASRRRRWAPTGEMAAEPAAASRPARRRRLPQPARPRRRACPAPDRSARRGRTTRLRRH